MYDTSHSPKHKNNTPVKKIHRTADEWRSIIADYKTSGLTQHSFCQQRDIAYSSFTTWFLKLKKSSSGTSAQNASPALFIDVLADKQLLPESGNEWDVELAFANGMVLRLKQGKG